MKEIKKGTYRHYKGNLYNVIGIGRHSETLDPVVLYHAIKDQNEFWVRPLEIFEEDIEYEGKKLKRFVYVE